MSDSLQKGLDRVYAASRDRFVAERNALAQQLRDQGDSEGADQVGKLRKPTLVAWALNGLSQAEPDMVKQLLELQDSLETADSADSLRQASERRQSVVEQLTRATVEILDDAGHPGGQWRDRIELSLLAMGTNAEAADVFRRGRLAQEVEPGTTWSQSAIAGAAVQQDAGPVTEKRQVERAKKDLQVLRDKARKLEQRAEKATEREEQAIRDAKDAAHSAQEARAEANRKEAELAEAERHLS